MTTIERIKRKFHEGCANYHLLADGDRVLIGLSGGKDSLLLARLLADRSRLYSPKFSVEAVHVVMDNIPYAPELGYLQQYCDGLGLPLHILHTSFDESTDRRKTKCFLCSWNRRKTLFRYAEEHGFNKVALGHHQDDILTTWLMNVTFEGANDTMRPMVEMRNYPLSIVRPLCLVPEPWIREVAEAEGLVHQKTPCPYETRTRRTDMGQIFQQLEAMNPEARYSMWRALGEVVK